MLSKIKDGFWRWGRITPQSSLYDRTLFLLFIILLFIGFIAVTTASFTTAAKLYDDPLYFTIRDGVYIVTGVALFFFVLQIPMEKWEKWSTGLYLLALISLIVVLIVGRNINGATRWISLGFVNFQPAELAKLALICYLSSFFVRKYDVVTTRQLIFIRPTIVCGILILFLLCQPDLGSSVVLFVITFGMLFVVGAKIFQFFLLIGMGASMLMFLIVISPYRMKRVTSYMDPFADAFGTGYQLSNSLMAFGNGEFWGQGLGNSVLKLEYLPEAHTDFVLAIIGEEFGFVGVLVIVFLLSALVFRALKIGKESLKLEAKFRGFFAFGIAFWIFFQGFVNLGVTIGLLPTKGLTFPLISYGGSSLIIMCIAIGILMRVDHENRLASGHAHLRDD
ncbi:MULTISPECIES: putative lipid II flippase FtsW [Gallibacterium]|uniref:Probable peptidoglycan glycosyltransferase FtsW n=1 Tax=Gallibacterium genomosp. 3 TaxID=505345 RepID=A0A1A7NQ37_9PAST|nr:MULTISPECIES: putative lipid II flippase FtsW [Gallibacterium]MDA3978141.1 putative lipid II flippase FtsW [Gallibacterium sp. AGMB14963]OBW91720.1 cell division protein FtsW [Gallibacterium genomosp. 3]